MDYNIRFKDAEWFGKQHDIILGGLGGIGNGVATELCKLNHNLYIYEFDSVEAHNCIPQGYSLEQIGLTKYKAFEDNVKKFVKTYNIQSEGKYNQDSLSSKIMFSCFDNMNARKLMFNNWKNNENRQLFIDSRLLAEVFQVFVVTPDNQDRYEEYLFDDSEVEVTPCTYKQTSHIAKMLHGYVISLFNAWLVNKKYNMEVRNLPFYSSYEAPINNWNYEN